MGPVMYMHYGTCMLCISYYMLSREVGVFIVTKYMYATEGKVIT